MLGSIYLKFQQKEQASHYFRSALERDPANYDALFTLGSIKEEEDEVNEAYEYYSKAYQYSCNSAALWNNIGTNMLNKKKDIVAYCCLKRALFLDPFRWDIHANLARLFMRRKK